MALKHPQYDLPIDFWGRVSGANINLCSDIIDGEFFGETTASQTLNPGLLTNDSTLYTPTVILGIPPALVLNPDLLVNTAILYAPQLEYVIAVPLFTNSSSLHIPTVTPKYSLALPLFTNTITLYSPTVAPGSVALSTGLINNSNSLYTPVIHPGNVALAVGLLTNGNTLYAPTIIPVLKLNPSLLNYISILYAPTALPKEVYVSPDVLLNTNIFYNHLIIPGNIFLLTNLLNNTSEIFIPSILLEEFTQKVELNTLINTSTLSSPILILGNHRLSMPLLNRIDSVFYTPYPGEYHIEYINTNEHLYLINTSNGNVIVYVNTLMNYTNLGPNITIVEVSTLQPTTISVKSVKIKVQDVFTYKTLHIR